MPNLTELFTSPDGRSAAARARRRRHERLLARFPDLARMRVLDLGGEVHTWLGRTTRPAEIVLLNLPWKAQEQDRDLAGRPEAEWMSAVGGDACDPPSELVDERFDLVYSNSVIEHVGGHQRREAFASSVHALAEHHWIQTPNRYFPVEPHWLFPGFQWLPASGRVGASHRWPIGHYSRRRHLPERDRVGDVLAVELVSAVELSFYFPTSEILRERALGLTKSLIAVG
jgi:hypothetical protein